ncbi:MAG: SMP-30/gluconolactonase/LRE family protein [Candidatus Limnocylindria bacterium]
MRRISILLALMIGMALPAATTAAPFPDRIELPDTFAPEGIAVGSGATFYTGSLAGQGIWRGDLRSGDGDFLVDEGGPFVGMKVDAFDRLWVAGGPAGNGYVFDAGTGDLLSVFQLAPAGEPTFVNDVVVTGDAAWFTDSFRGVVYRVDLGTNAITEVDLTALAPAEAGVFRLNGIDATPNGKTLVVVNSTAGELYRIDAATLDVSTIDMGGASVAGDGILLAGHTLYAVRNQDHVAVIDLAPDLSSGTIVEQLTGDLDIPTTVARFGSSLYVVNARFGTDDEPPVPYWVTRLDR